MATPQMGGAARSIPKCCNTCLWQNTGRPEGTHNHTHQRTTHVLDCPHDSVVNILSHLTATGLARVQQSCKQLRHVVATADAALWQELYCVQRCLSHSRRWSCCHSLSWRERYQHDAAELSRHKVEADDLLSSQWRLRFTWSAGGGPHSRSYQLDFERAHVRVEGFPAMPWYIKNGAVIISTFPRHVATRRRDGTWVLSNENVVIYAVDRKVTAARQHLANRSRYLGDCFFLRGEYAPAAEAYAAMLEYLGDVHDAEMDVVLTSEPLDICLRVAALARLANVCSICAARACCMKCRAAHHSRAVDAAARAVSAHIHLLSPCLQLYLRQLVAAETPSSANAHVATLSSLTLVPIVIDSKIQQVFATQTKSVMPTDNQCGPCTSPCTVCSRMVS